MYVERYLYHPPTKLGRQPKISQAAGHWNLTAPFTQIWAYPRWLLGDRTTDVPLCNKRPDFAATNRVSEVQLHARNRAIIRTHSWAPTLAVGQPLQPPAVAPSSIDSDVNTGTISPVTPLSGSTTRRNPLLDHWPYHRKLQRIVRQPDLLNHLAKRKSVAARSAATVTEDRGRKLKKYPLWTSCTCRLRRKGQTKRKASGGGSLTFPPKEKQNRKSKKKVGEPPSLLFKRNSTNTKPVILFF